MESLLAAHPAVTLDADDAGRFLSGLRRRGSLASGARTRAGAVFGADPQAFLGTAHVTAGELIPGRLLSPIEIQDMLAVRSPVSSPAAAPRWPDTTD